MNRDDRAILDAFQDRLEQVENHIITFNREMGEVLGRLGVLTWLIRGVLLAVLGKIVLDFFV